MLIKLKKNIENIQHQHEPFCYETDKKPRCICETHALQRSSEVKVKIIRLSILMSSLASPKLEKMNYEMCIDQKLKFMDMHTDRQTNRQTLNNRDRVNTKGPLHTSTLGNYL